MSLFRPPSPLRIWFALLLTTALNLVAAAQFGTGPLGALAFWLLGTAKAALIVFGFMQMHRESWLLSGALTGYTCTVLALAGLKTVAIGGLVP